MTRFSRHDHALEKIQANEEGNIAFLLDDAEKNLHKAAQKRIKQGKPVQRGAHAPPHGLVIGSLTVCPDLPADLKAGLFATPAVYPVVIRYSKAFGLPDWAPNAHGCAIKVLNVEGPNCWADATVQDIVCNNDTAFPFRDLEQYAIGTRAGIGRYLFGSLNPTRWRYREIGLTYSAVHRILSSVLHQQYWSQLPFAWGVDKAAKYSIRAIGPVGAPAVKKSNKGSRFGWNNYLTGRLERQLASGGFELELMVQFQQPGEAVEDPQVRWTGRFRRVATIHIPQQPVDRPDNWWLAEACSFNIGRTLRFHQPIGGIARVRPLLYEHISELRTTYNNLKIDANGLPLLPESWSLCPILQQRLENEFRRAKEAAGL